MRQFRLLMGVGWWFCCFFLFSRFTQCNSQTIIAHMPADSLSICTIYAIYTYICALQTRHANIKLHCKVRNEKSGWEIGFALVFFRLWFPVCLRLRWQIFQWIYQLDIVGIERVEWTLMNTFLSPSGGAPISGINHQQSEAQVQLEGTSNSHFSNCKDFRFLMAVYK